jgi:signal peptidase II
MQAADSIRSLRRGAAARKAFASAQVAGGARRKRCAQPRRSAILAAMTVLRQRLLLAAVALGSLACDQATKHAAKASLERRPAVSLLGGAVKLLFAENTGAWGSLGASWPEPMRTLVLVALPLLVLGAVVLWLLRQRSAHPVDVVGGALVIGGGLGNLVDRIARGSVIDFLFIGVGPLHTNVFNVADVVLLAGIGLLIVPGWLRGRGERRTIP